jgi:hypothetical protein
MRKHILSVLAALILAGGFLVASAIVGIIPIQSAWIDPPGGNVGGSHYHKANCVYYGVTTDIISCIEDRGSYCIPRPPC